MIKLRPYQVECIDTIIQKFNLEHITRQLVSLPTAAGKTVIFASLIKKTAKRTLILAHTNELLVQARDKIKMIDPNIEVGLINANNKEFECDVVVSSIQSARVPTNLKKLYEQNFDMVICDECHHCASDSYRHVLDTLGFGQGTQKLIVGFSATAFRNDGRGLAHTFDQIVYERSIREMIFDGYLCKPKGKKVALSLDFSSVKEDGDDFNQKSLSKLMDNDLVRSIIVDAYEEHGKGRPTICFGVDVAHATNLSHDFRNRGIRSAVVHGSMSAWARDDILKQYSRGDIDVLTNCMILTEGYDEPKTSCVIVGRPTKSKGLYQQMVGRGLRLSPEKQDCIVIDLCDVNHNICTVPYLTEDAEVVEAQKDEETQECEKTQKIPEKLNPRLKSVLLNFDPLGTAFQWKKDGDCFRMVGNNLSLHIEPQGNGLYWCYAVSDNKRLTLAEGLDFGYAFGVAEDYANERKTAFILSDRNAKWRDQPISVNQLKALRNKGYKAGIDELTKGQASDLLNSLYS